MRNFSRGTAQQLIDVLEGKIAEFEGGGYVESATNTGNIAAAPSTAIESKEGTDNERYLHTLIGDIQKAFPKDYSVVFDYDDENLYITVNSTGAEDPQVTEYTVPFSDLKMDFNSTKKDVDYIMKEILPDDVKSAEDPMMNRRYVMKHGMGPGTLPRDVTIDNYEDSDYYSVVDLNRPLTDEEIEQYDLSTDIDRYVGGCNVKASFDDENVTIVYDDTVESNSKINASFGEEVVNYEDGYDQYELLDHKEVLDSDGTTTDYALYYDPENNEWFCMFGDMEIYPPDPAYSDMSFDDETAAYEWFENYDGFAEDFQAQLDEAFIDDMSFDDEPADDADPDWL